MITRGRLRVLTCSMIWSGQVMHIDDGFADAGGSELVEHMVEQRLAGHAHQRLRHRVGQGAHAQPEAGGEHHGFVGSDGIFRTVSIIISLRRSYHGDSASTSIRRHSHRT